MSLRIPQISEQTFLVICDEVREKWLWDNDKHIELVISLFDETRWQSVNQDDLHWKISLSLLTGGRSSVDVFKLTFTDNANRQDTFIIRSHPSQKDAEVELINVVKKLDINQVDCFADIIGKLFDIPNNRYLVIYRHMTDNMVGEPVDELGKCLCHYSLVSESNAERKQFQNSIDTNFQGFIKQVTKRYEEVEDHYKTIMVSKYCRHIISQLPPDLIVSNAYLYEVTSKNCVVQPKNNEMVIPHNSEQLDVIPITQILIDNKASIQSKWIRITEKLCFDGNEAVLTGNSQTAYLPLIMVDDKQRVRIWIEIDKNEAQRLESHLDTIKEYGLLVFDKNLTTFATQLQTMGFDTQSCLSTSDFQELCEKRHSQLHTNMRHNDLHCGNVLVSGSHFKVIDVGDMKPDLIASDIARLEVSLWFEMANQLSKEEAEAVLNNLTKKSSPGSTLSSKARIFSLILRKLNQGFREGVKNQESLKDSEINLAYVIQILLYQRYCLLDGIEKIPTAFNVFARHWISQFRGTGHDPKPNPIAVLRRAYFVYVAGHADELQDVKQDVSAYGEGVEAAMDWKPYCPPLEKRIVMIAQQASTHADLICETIPLNDKLIQNIEHSKENNNIVIIIVDPWTLQLPQYAKMMQQYDKCHFFNCSLLVPFNLEDPETKEQYSELRDTLEGTFVNKTIDKLDSFRDDIRSMEKLTQEIINALANTRQKIISLTERVRKINRKGEGFSLKPKNNPRE